MAKIFLDRTVLQDQRHLLDEDEIRWRLKRVVERTRAREPWSDRRRLEAQLKGDKAWSAARPTRVIPQSQRKKRKNFKIVSASLQRKPDTTASHW
ncbi:hypothetical protein NKJ71_26180 [Mesorhizobium sp. M0050]|uniref:hypothetical protein n=1 Tax=Mesorhizobium sp. M0050 TaxID=2956861 RepID=UPI0033379990